jgi:ankyrin repeat protein
MGVIMVLLGAGADANKAIGGAFTDMLMCTPLTMAALRGNVAAIMALLGAGAEVDLPMARGVTPLHVAANCGQLAAVTALLRAGACVNEAADNGSTPSSVASHSGHEAVLTTLVQAALGKAPISVATKSWCATLLIDAARRNDTAIVVALLRAGVDVDEPSRDSKLPALFSAILSGNVAVMTVLLRWGAEANKACGSLGSPLEIALHKGREAPVALLLAWHADSNIVCGDKGSSLLAVAVRKGNEALVALLLAWGSDVNGVSGELKTPLSVAVQDGNETLVALLLAGGADTNKAIKDGQTPLGIAALEGHVGLVTSLLGAKADVDKARGDNGYTPLMLAAGAGHVAVAVVLLEAGADANKATDVNDVHTTPLLLAAIRGHATTVAVLLKGGADVGNTGSGFEASTPLRMALHNGHASVAALLHSWTLARGDPCQQYFIGFSQLPKTLAIVDPHGCSLSQLPTEVIRAILTKPPSCRHLSHQVRLCNLFVLSPYRDLSLSVLRARSNVMCSPTGSVVYLLDCDIAHRYPERCVLMLINSLLSTHVGYCKRVSDI